MNIIGIPKLKSSISLGVLSNLSEGYVSKPKAECRTQAMTGYASDLRVKNRLNI